jgi:acetyl-CoA C-acetyltransferase
MRRRQSPIGRGGQRVTEAVIVPTARTPAGKAYRGALSGIFGPQLAAHALTGALDRARGHR